MAQETTRRRGRKAAAPAEGNGDAAGAREAEAEAKAERGPTKRVVLRRERVIVLPDDVTDEALSKLASGDGAKQLAKLLGLSGSAKVPTASIGAETWAVVGEFEGSSKQNAIEAYAGKPLTPDAKPGTYKAPSASAFAGGRQYDRPPQPKVEAKDIE